jgi:hypothetical protein
MGKKDDVTLTAVQEMAPAGRPTVNLTLQFKMEGVPRDPRMVRKSIMEAAEAMISQIVLSAARAVEVSIGVRLNDEPPSLPWRPMEPAIHDPAKVAELAEALNVAPEVITRDQMWRNDLYQATVRKLPDAPGRPAMAHLSIRRFDRAAVHDWRHFQMIKNDIFGPEAEAAEVYPAESRLVDQANQYHLWVITEPGVGLPFGFGAREVSENVADVPGARQRHWCDDDRPADLKERIESAFAPEVTPAHPGGLKIAEPVPEVPAPADPDEGKVFAPFTPEQVKSLNRFQRLRSGFFHGFTCGSGDRMDEAHGSAKQLHNLPDHGTLLARESGWYCPACDYTQNWAWSLMADEKKWREVLEAQERTLRELKSAKPTES